MTEFSAIAKTGDVDIDTFTLEQYMVLTRGSQGPGVVMPEIGNNVNFEIEGQFIRELREITFLGCKKDDAYEHVERVLDIVGLFSIQGISHDVVMLRVFVITLIGAAKRWIDRLPSRSIDTWDLIEKAFIERYCPPSKTIKQLEEIHNFKQEGDETLYQAWERYNDLLYKYPTRDLNSHRKSIQDMADNSQKWHNGASNRRTSNNNSDGITVITSKLDNLGRDMKKLQEDIHAIQFGRPFTNNGGKGARYRVGPPGYYNKVDNHPPFSERKSSLEEIINKYLEESAKKQAERDA
ncbi:hypothetical protein Tco_0762424 [Tanacetum coccineum]